MKPIYHDPRCSCLDFRALNACTKDKAEQIRSNGNRMENKSKYKFKEDFPERGGFDSLQISRSRLIWNQPMLETLSDQVAAPMAEASQSCHHPETSESLQSCIKDERPSCCGCTCLSLLLPHICKSFGEAVPEMLIVWPVLKAPMGDAASCWRFCVPGKTCLKNFMRHLISSKLTEGLASSKI